MSDNKTNKQALLGALVEKRRARILPGYSGIGDFHDGYYECDFVSPWTKSASNLDADLMLLAQDWASSDYLSRTPNEHVARLGHDPKLFTNVNLQHLLGRHLGLKFGDTYATEIFPFVRLGSMSADIPARVFNRCAIDCALPQIDIVAPKIVICLGI